MAVKQPILRQDAQLFEIILPDGRTVQVKMTLEGYRFFEAILERLVAGGL
jgi:hypothetical protein